ncbi:origin recognition complex subunit 1, partial [Aphelenchoides avenae]
MDIQDPSAIFRFVLRSMLEHEGKQTQKAVSAPIALQQLGKIFAEPIVDRDVTFIVVDEIDLLCHQKRQEALYEIVNWCSNPSAGINVIGISNVLDLPKRMTNSRVGSRIGSNRAMFQPYTFAELEVILTDRLQCGGIDPNAVALTSRKDANLTGELRKAMDLLRNAVDIAEAKSADEVRLEH